MTESPDHPLGGCAVVLAPQWPGNGSGYAIALDSSLRVYRHTFESLVYVAVCDSGPESSLEAEHPNVDFRHVPVRRGPLAARFAASIVSRYPATWIAYAAGRPSVSRILSKLQGTPGREIRAVILEDIPMGVFAGDSRHIAPSAPVVLRSHDVMVRAYGDMVHHVSGLRRIAWTIERRKLRRAERRLVTRVDSLWTITGADREAYERLSWRKPNGVLGVSVDQGRYASLPEGDSSTLVHIGSADLRKGMGLRWYLDRVWPEVRKRIPTARFVIAGRGTERLARPHLGVTGLGYLEDERMLLSLGRVFINPQQIATGVQLKSIVAMAAGRALLTTVESARGLEGEPGHDFLAYSDEHEAISLSCALLGDERYSSAIGQRGSTLVADRYNATRLLSEAGAAFSLSMSQLTGRA